MTVSNDEIARWITERIEQIGVEADHLRAQLDDLETEQRGLELTLARIPGALQHRSRRTINIPRRPVAQQPSEEGELELETPPVVEVTEYPPGALQFQNMGHTEAITKVLEKAERLMSPADILSELQAAGYQIEDSDPIRGALAYLKRKKRADLARRGAWYLVGSPAHQAFERDGDLLSETDSVSTTGNLTDAETPTADAAGVSVSEVRVEGGLHHPAALAG